MLENLSTEIIPGIITALCGSAFFSALITNYVTNKNEKKRREFERDAKIAEFREQWISDLRDTMAKFQSYGMLPNTDPTREREFYMLGTKIELLMNPLDEDYKALQGALYKFLASAKGNTRDKYANNSEYVEICQRILNREWNKLKKSLNTGC